jgi:replicative DNA helicase
MAKSNSQNLDPGRVPPQNAEAERAVLGGVLLEPDAIVKVVDILTPDDFYQPDHALIYDACAELFNTHKPIDLITLTDALESKNKLKEAGGASYLSSLVANTTSAANIVHYAQIVQGKSVLRRLIQVSSQITTRAYDDNSEDVIDLLDNAEKSLFSVAERRLGANFIPVKNILTESFERIDELHRNKGQLRGVPTGFKELDNRLSGLQPSDLVILAARPSMGKTALALNIAAHAAIQHKISVGVFSLEMSKEQLVDRLLTMEAMIDSWRLRTGNLEEDDFSKINFAMGELSEAPLFIDDTPLLGVLEIKAKARRLQAEHGLGLIVVDYLQLMEGSRRSSSESNRVQEVSEISRGLKALARELKVPVMALSQLSRAVESRPGSKIPQLSDLRDSGCLAGDTLIYLPKSGVWETITNLEGKKNFLILAQNHQTGKLEADTVSKAFCTGVKPVWIIETQLGRQIKATVNHKFLTEEGWRRLDELSPQDYVALPRYLPNPKKSLLSQDQLALLGHLIGDGCVLPRHAVQYTTGSKLLADEVVKLARRVFGHGINSRVHKEKQWYQVYLAASERLARGKYNPVAKWFRELGIFAKRSYEKYLPNQVFASREDDAAVFLRHLWATDGCIKLSHGQKHYIGVYYASSSRELARGVQTLLLKLGIVARVSRHSQGNKGHDQFHVTVSGSGDLRKFIDQVGTVGTYRKKALDDLRQYLTSHPANTNRDIIPKSVWRTMVLPAMRRKGITTRQLQKRLGCAYCGSTLYKANLSRERALKVARIVDAKDLARLALGDIYWDKISSITPAGTEKVYDLTVKKNHNFVGGGLIVHNSIEQDADVVMFIYREEYYEPDTDKKGIAQILIRKHRNGPTGEAELYFHAPYSRFADIEKKGFTTEIPPA